MTGDPLKIMEAGVRDAEARGRMTRFATENLQVYFRKLGEQCWRWVETVRVKREKWIEVGKGKDPPMVLILLELEKRGAEGWEYAIEIDEDHLIALAGRGFRDAEK